MNISGLDPGVAWQSIRVKTSDPIRVIDVNPHPAGYGKSSPGSGYSIRITLGQDLMAMSTTGCELHISYITLSACWSPSHEIDLRTTDPSAVLATKARITNVSRESWEQCEMTLCFRQAPSYNGSHQGRACAAGTSINYDKNAGEMTVVEEYRHQLLLRKRQNEESAMTRVTQPASSHKESPDNEPQNKSPMDSVCDGTCRQRDERGNREIQQAGGSYECLRKEIGSDATWHLIGVWIPAHGRVTLPRPISHIEFGDIIISHIFDTAPYAIYLKADFSEMPALPKGPVWVTLDSGFMGTTTLSNSLAGKAFSFTCMDTGIKVVETYPLDRTIHQVKWGETRAFEIQNTRCRNSSIMLFLPRRISISRDKRTEIFIIPPDVMMHGEGWNRIVEESSRRYPLNQVSAWKINLRGGGKVAVRLGYMGPSSR
ncbi:hypothetical protein G7046_g9252 [Stylonectria norvegica]|nr:hypothetical protein G7046_g9252 [Stylonectria norvegica]